MPESRSAEEFGRLVREHESRLYGYVFGIHPNRADVEDILQDTIFTLWEKFDEFDRGRPFFNWACRFAYLRTLSFRQKHQNRDRILSASAFEIMANLSDSVLPRDREGEQKQIDALEHCLDKLSDDDRELLDLRYQSVRGAELGEFSRSKGVSLDTIYKRLERIRGRLRDCVTTWGGGACSVEANPDFG